MKSSREKVLRFTFHGIRNVSRTNGRNVKQPKAQKTDKKVAKRSNDLAEGWNQL